MIKNVNKNEVEVVELSTFGSKEVYNQFKTVFETRSLLGKNKLKAYGFMILSNIKFNLDVTVGDARDHPSDPFLLVSGTKNIRSNIFCFF